MVLIYIKETINHVIGFCLDPSSHAYGRNDFLGWDYFPFLSLHM